MVSDWPGNVRQLCNEIQRTVARAEDGAVITPEQLSPELKRTSSPTAPSAASIASMPSSSNLQGPGTLADALAEVERRMIADALRRHGGNISRAARELGLTRRGLVPETRASRPQRQCLRKFVVLKRRPPFVFGSRSPAQCWKSC